MLKIKEIKMMQMN